MAQRNKPSAAFIPNDLGFHALVFDEADVVRLLRAAVEREGGQSAFAKHHGVARAYLNMVLNGKKSLVIPLQGLSAFARVTSPNKSAKRSVETGGRASFTS